jgi:hypothetical protein
LEGSSFAGMYETFLGVTRERLKLERFSKVVENMGYGV